jgi:hypothetical protein
VQTVLRHSPTTEPDAYPTGRQEAELLARQALPEQDTATTQWERVLPHLFALAATTPPHSPASPQSADAYEAAAQYLRRQGREAHTISLLEATTAQCEQVLGDTHPDTLTSATLTNTHPKKPNRGLNDPHRPICTELRIRRLQVRILPSAHR